MTLGGRFVLVVLMALLGGCQTAGMVSLHAANGLAALGPYDRAVDVAYGDLERQKLDVYTPRGVRGGSGGRPVIVFFHGGDWSNGYPGKEAHVFVADALVSRGFVAVVANYRRYPDVRFPTFVEDAAAAVVWTHRHIAEYGGDPERLFVMGHSAGAHLASMVALDDRYIQEAGGDPNWVTGLIGMAGPYSFLPMPDEPLLKDLFGPPTRYELSQPVNYVDAQDPPMLLLSGEQDTRVPLTCMNRLVAAAEQRGANVRTRTFWHLDHIMLVGVMALPIRIFDRGVLNEIERFVADTPPATPLTPPHPLKTASTSGLEPPDASRSR